MMNRMKAYDFHYKGCMSGVKQSVAMGNGDVGVNLWVDSGGVLFLLMSKTDHWSERSRLLKTGLVAVRFEPNPFREDTELDFSLYDAVLTIRCGTLAIRAYVDANAPCCRVVAEAEEPVSAEVSVVNYRGEPMDAPRDPWFDCVMGGAPVELPESADTVFTRGEYILGQYHHNRQSCYAYTLENQGLSAYIGRERDPLLNRVFGLAARSGQLRLKSGLLGTPAPVRFLELAVCSLTQADSAPDRWLDAIEALSAASLQESEASLCAHKRVWHDFWERSWIFIDGDKDAERATRGYLYQRYMHRAGGLGAYPILFTGSIFTVHPDPSGNLDNRNWDGPYWIQNTRLIYWSILYSGDFDLMQPFLRMFTDMIPISRERVRTYYRHSGMCIPETVSFFGTYANMCYGYTCEDGTHKGGWQRNLSARLPGEIPNPYTRWHFNGMLEIAYLMLRYIRYAPDEAFAGKALEFAREVLLFFAGHFERLDGKLLLYPVSALETWQNCVNDLPDIAGLMAVTGAILDDGRAPDDLAELCQSLRASLPELPRELVNGRMRLLPCEIKIDRTPRNGEHPELYAVFPFYLYGAGKPDIDNAIAAYDNRSYPYAGAGSAGWSQDGIQAAILGLAGEAKRFVTLASAQQDPDCVFPGNWGPHFDETPDQDQGSCLMLTLQHMLVASADGTHRLLPAWPEDWNVSFRLPLWGGGTTECVYRDGEIKSVRFSREQDAERAQYPSVKKENGARGG